MEKILDVRSVGWLHNLKGDTRSPESIALPACMTSLMEFIGEDPVWITIQAHDREWTKRALYNDLLAATGMSFGLLWHETNCPSCMDLTQVNEHDVTIGRAFDYMGYDYRIVERSDSNYQEMKAAIVASLDAGRPVLAFGVVGPPECAVVCGYENDGETLLGWSHFQSYDPADCAENGMFRKSGWHADLWKIVLCKEKTERKLPLTDIARRGVSIMDATELSGYHAGDAAYDAWIRYIGDAAYDTADDETLRQKYWLHHAAVGNHAEARCYLGGFFENNSEHPRLREAAKRFDEIHTACWKVWGVAGGMEKPDGHLCLRDGEKRKEIISILQEIRSLDHAAREEIRAWLAE